MSQPHSPLSLPEIILSGSPYEMGRQHGTALAVQIRNFVRDDFARVQAVRLEPLDKEKMTSMVRDHSEMIRSHFPEAAMELEGLANGAGISYEEAVLLQVRQELIRFGDPLMDAMECSTIGGIRKDGTTLVGQTVDLPGNLAPLACVFRIIPEHNRTPEICMFGFCGLLGYLGVNNRQLSLNINMVISANWKSGVPPYLLVRKMLACNTIDEALKSIKDIPRSSSRSFMLADAHRIVTAELTVEEMRLLEETPSFHTNHFLHPDFKNRDVIHFLFLNSSRKRLECLKEITSSVFPETPSEMFDIFSDHTLYPTGICVHSEGNIRVQETVAAVVMEPSSGKMFVRPGNPCASQTFEFGKSTTTIKNNLSIEK